MLTSFALALTSLLQLQPETKALQAIAKATVQEHFAEKSPKTATLQQTTEVASLFQLSLRNDTPKAILTTPTVQSPMEVAQQRQPQTPGLTPATVATEWEKQALSLPTTSKPSPAAAPPTRSRLPVA